MVSVARSLGLYYVCGTQSIDELESRLDEKRTLATLGNFRNFITYDATAKTLAYSSARLGATARLNHSIWAENDEVKGINQFQSLAASYREPSSDGGLMSIATQKVARNNLRSGLKTIIFGKEDEDKNKLQGESNMSKSIYLIKTELELGIDLTQRFSALALINRAGAPRRDIVIVEPTSSL